LENLDEDHLAKILLGGPPRAMCADEFRDQRVKTAHKFARRTFIFAKDCRDQRGVIRFLSQVVQIVSTLIV
jgi:hypothetical protein